MFNFKNAPSELEGSRKSIREHIAYIREKVKLLDDSDEKHRFSDELDRCGWVLDEPEFDLTTEYRMAKELKDLEDSIYEFMRKSGKAEIFDALENTIRKQFYFFVEKSARIHEKQMKKEAKKRLAVEQEEMRMKNARNSVLNIDLSELSGSYVNMQDVKQVLILLQKCFKSRSTEDRYFEDLLKRAGDEEKTPKLMAELIDIIYAFVEKISSEKERI